MHGREFRAMGQCGPSLQEQFYAKPSGKSCHEIITIPNETSMESSCVTGRMAYYILSSILFIGVLMLVLIPLGSTFLYIDYKQQLAQRKSNKNDLCKSKCSYGAECVVDEYTNQPFCRCLLSCADDYEPVCGSDGSTYVNLCHLRYESCNKQQAIALVTNGPCDTNLCDNVTCQRYQKCQVDEKGKAKCVCASNTNCTSTGQPVCGSNNKLFDSLCELQRHACLYNLDIIPTTLELCLEKGSLIEGKHHHDHQDTLTHHQHPLKLGFGTKCGSQVCGHYAQCKTLPSNHSSSTTVQVCQCPTECSSQANDTPVCGTNNQNYANECQLKRDACLRQVDLKVLHHGHCGRCRQRCEHYAQCKPNEQGVPECVCPQVCIRVDRPVCGDNGVTYENECELQVASCRLQQPIQIRFNGSCDLCHNVVCPYGATCIDGQCLCANNCENNAAEPLCANDGNTYQNECELRRIACQDKKELIALFYGECEESNKHNDNYLDDSVSLLSNLVETEPSSLVQLSAAQQSECYQSLQMCRQSKLEHGQIYICEDGRKFHSKCDMIEYKCRNANSQHKCSKYCYCNQNGIKTNSHSACNPLTGQCQCKEGVSGLRCDRCSNKFWGFQHLMDDPYANGCRPCKCNKMGSVSETCDKTSGTCRCRPGWKGPKCDQCQHNWHLTSRGCVPNWANSCQHLKCAFGAVCRQHNGTRAECSCQLNCNTHSQSTAAPVCASDGTTHQSMCHFREHMCRLQKRVHITKHCPE